MAFVPISIEAYLEKCKGPDPEFDVSELNIRLMSALQDYNEGIKCECGNDIWVIGSAHMRRGCFECITGEIFSEGDYEIEEAIIKNEDFPVEGFQEEIDYSQFNGFFDDDGNKLNPDLIQKPGLCLTCKYENDPSEETLCILTRLDQSDNEEFKCYSYQQK